MNSYATARFEKFNTDDLDACVAAAMGAAELDEIGAPVTDAVIVESSSSS